MAWFPISHTVPQYVDSSGVPYSGAVLKAYSDGTSTVINIATDATGATTTTSVALNASGYPVVSGNVIIPHIQETYKLALYPTQAAADSNTGAIWTVDSIAVSGDFGSSTESISTSTILDSTDELTHKEISGTVTISLPTSGFTFTARNAGSGIVTFDPDGSETINGAATLLLYPGESGIFQYDTINSAWSVTGYKSPQAEVDVASATTTDLGAAASEHVNITGTTTITGLGTISEGVIRYVRFAGALTLTHNATSLILPGAANITTAAGDYAVFVSAGSGNWRCILYSPAGALPINRGGTGQITAAAAFNALKQAATDSATGVLEIAVQSEMEAGSSTTLAVTPGRQHFHPSAAKAWGRFNGTGTPAFANKYNGTSITDSGTGDYTVNLPITLSSANDCALASGTQGDTTSGYTTCVTGIATTSIDINTQLVSSGAWDSSLITYVVFGDI